MLILAITHRDAAGKRLGWLSPFSLKIDRNFRLLYHNPAARALHGPAPEKTPPPHCYEWL